MENLAALTEFLVEKLSDLPVNVPLQIENDDVGKKLSIWYYYIFAKDVLLSVYIQFHDLSEFLFKNRSTCSTIM